MRTVGLQDGYRATIKRLMDEVDSTQQDAMVKTADAVATSVAGGGAVHIFGSGHSHMLAEEVFYRAGGLVPVNAIFDPGLSVNHGAVKSTLLERLPGYAAAVLGDYEMSSGEPFLIVSNSGVNPVPVEMALEGRARGLLVVALTSVQASSALRPRHPCGQRLYELADIVIDNRVPSGDASLDVPGYPGIKAGPVSTMLGAYILNNIMVMAIEKIAAMGQEPPVFASANVPDSAERNAWLVAHYRRQVRGF